MELNKFSLKIMPHAVDANITYYVNIYTIRHCCQRNNREYLMGCLLFANRNSHFAIQNDISTAQFTIYILYKVHFLYNFILCFIFCPKIVYIWSRQQRHERPKKEWMKEWREKSDTNLQNISEKKTAAMQYN